jgi:Na+/melibiose symporter-like transporter
VLNATLALHYFTWYAQIHAGAALSTIQTAFYTGAMAGVLCWLALARRAEKKTLYLAATLATALLLCGATVLVGPGRPFGTGNPLPLVIGHALAGLLASAVWVIPASMAADVADWDELTTGLRREGMFFGILNFGEKIAAGGAVLAAGVLLGASGKLLPRVPSGAPASASAIAFLYGVAPAAVLLAAAACVVPYRLNRRTVREVQHTLDASRGSATPVKSVGTALPV